jgi:Ca2+-binding RTX toxin-like protein
MHFDMGNFDDDDALIRGPGTEKKYGDDWDAWGINEDWRFTDYASWVDGQQLSIFIDGLGMANHFVLFGTHGNETLVGDATVDHLYGGDGVDTLEGKGGADYLEGGAGKDTYVYAAGDGADILFDSDGQGVLLWAGQTVKGKTEVTPKSWIKESAVAWRDDQNGYRYFLTPGAHGTQDLQIGKNGDWITIRAWREGGLGISLGGGEVEATLFNGDQRPPVVKKGVVATARRVTRRSPWRVGVANAWRQAANPADWRDAA